MDKNKTVLLIVGIVLALCIVACGAMVVGGALVYGIAGRHTEVLQIAPEDLVPELRFDEVLPEGEEFVLPAGVIVIEVTPNSPADDWGLRVGDIIQSIDGQQLDEEHDLADVIAQYEPGDAIDIQTMRMGEGTTEGTIRLGENPDKPGVAYLGVKYTSMSGHMQMPEGMPRHIIPREDMPQSPGMPGRNQFGQGALVVKVAAGSPADQAGIQTGDVINMVDGNEIDDSSELIQYISERRPGEKVTLTIFRNGTRGQQDVTVVLGENPDKEGAAYLGVYLN